MWKLTYEHGCWIAESQFGQQIWAKDKAQLERLFSAAGCSFQTSSVLV